MTASPPPVDLDALETALAAATPGPWFFDSYSTIMSTPLIGEYNDAEELTPDDAPDEAYDGLPEFVTARVPVAAGDTSTRQGAADAAAIVAAVNSAPALIAELRALRAKVAAVEALAGRMQDDAEHWVGPGPSVEDIRTAAVVRNLRRALGSGS